MGERTRLGAMRRRLLAGFVFVSLVVLGIHTVGTVVPHLTAAYGHSEPVSLGWLLLATGVALASGLLVSLLVARRLAAPAEAVVEMARTFATGDRSARVPDFGRPELADLADALNAAAEEVDRSERARRQLTSDIAHELRTPLAALQAGLEELRDGLVPPDRELLAALHDQATRLGRLVNDLGELNAAESLGLRLGVQRVDLAAVARMAVASREASAASAGLELHLAVEDEDEVAVVGDPDRLHQVIGNLLSNSTLYCRPGDRIDVRVGAEGRIGVLEVADTGPGMSPEELHHAFDRAWRGAAARGPSGSGLGLAIVRALVLAQGGTVALRPVSPHGLLARVTLPLDEPLAGDARGEDAPAPTRQMSGYPSSSGSVPARR